VAIARAIVSRPQILILDEPTASLDGDTGKMIIAFVKERILNQQCCILIVTHDARINEYADRIITWKTAESPSPSGLRREQAHAVHAGDFGCPWRIDRGLPARTYSQTLPPAFAPASSTYDTAIYANGIIESEQSSGSNIVIYPQVAGPVTQVLVHEGQAVTRGLPLVTLDDALPKANSSWRRPR
jgi:energy-coupling factor transporter ATP-binding protein EcfA2